MADKAVPHFQNDAGVAIIHVGAREFMCIGASPPLDHPHVYLDMGADEEIICPYCSTLYRFRKSLGAAATDPTGCLWEDRAHAATA